METIRAVQIVKPEELRIIEMPMPHIDEKNNVLVKIKAAGLCGSDVGIYHGTNAAATYPRVIGHEMVGEVGETGPSAKKVKVGDRVIIDQVTSCGHCYACRIGRPNVCQLLAVRGVHIDGGYREYMAVPDTDCYLLPDFLRYEDAVLIEPTTIAIQACSRAQISAEDEVLIMGVGALGTRMLSIAKLSGAKIIVADVVDAKLEEALAAGAHHAINIARENIDEKIKIAETLANDPEKVSAAAFAEAQKLHFHYLELMNIMFSDVNPIPIKTAMNLYGFDAGECKLPLVPMSVAGYHDLKDCLAKYDLLNKV